MNEILRTEQFIVWESRLDKRIQAKVKARIARMAMGNLGDYKRINELVYEARIHIPSGVRLYYMWQGNKIILMLGGGDKDTQKKDVIIAKDMAEEMRKEYECD